MNQVYKVGDLVRLKSGGSIMVIQAMRGEGDNHAECVWHEGTAPHAAIYSLSVLTHKL